MVPSVKAAEPRLVTVNVLLTVPPANVAPKLTWSPLATGALSRRRYGCDRCICGDVSNFLDP